MNRNYIILYSFEPYKYQLIEWFAKNGKRLDIIVNQKNETLEQYIRHKKKSELILIFFQK